MQKSYPNPMYLKLALSIAMLLFTGLAKAEPADWEIDPDHFSIAFEVGHIGYQQQLGIGHDRPQQLLQKREEQMVLIPGCKTNN